MWATYLALDVATAAFPVAWSFEKRVHFRHSWRFAFLAILVVAVPFLAWDSWFTSAGVWTFNHQFLSGYFLGNLPIEECLFFVAIPFACLFIYRIVRDTFPTILSERAAEAIVWASVAAAEAIMLANAERSYTFVVAAAATATLLAALRFGRGRYLAPFVVAYIAHLAPFLLVNGILTALPVVQYNPDHILGYRAGTIPVEDFLYSLVLFLLNVIIFEALERSAARSG